MSRIHDTFAVWKNNFVEPDYFQDMVKDLLLKMSFTSIRVIDGMELVCGGIGYNLEKRRRQRLQPREAVAVTT
jgi:hypothetical protein